MLVVVVALLVSVFVVIDSVLSVVPLVKLVVLVEAYQNHFCLVLTVHLVGAS